MNRKLWKGIGAGLHLLLVFILFLAGFSADWAMKTWANLTMEEVIYHLLAPLDGLGGGMIGKYIGYCVLPAAGLTVLLCAAVFLVRKKTGKSFGVRVIGTVISVCFCAFFAYRFWIQLDLTTYIDNQISDTSFIGEQYVDPLKVGIEFPEQKRNLIFIFLESMETTYTDKENGGGFDYNCIPELTALAQDNEDFSGTGEKLNGGYVLSGTSWTMAALFAQTSGIPLQLSIEGNAMGTQEHFFPGMIALGDILEMSGYAQALMIGSEAEFGGRKLYFEDHGAYDILDYQYAIDTSLIPEYYKVSWGYEDKKLFEFAKGKISEMAKQDQPFNFTILTVDTHFEDGYVCEDCQAEFGENQYANVMACSSRKVAEFIEWVKEQDFYENTTIVLSGDHLTMDSNFCDDVSKDYVRKTYTCFINPGCENEQPEKRRNYTTLDIFPTTLASLGVVIEGDRLGLGTNLFSDTQTLAEEFGLSHVRSEIAKKSTFLEELAALDKTTDAYLKSIGAYPTALVRTELMENGAELAIHVSEIANLETLSGVELDLWENGQEEQVQTYTLQKTADGYVATLTIADYAGVRLESAIYVVDEEGRRYEIGALSGDLELYENNFCDYLTVLGKKEYTIFLAVRDEAATELNVLGRQKLKHLGLQIDLKDQIRSSYYAVLDGGKVISEQISQERIYEDGVLHDGKTTYGIMSSGFLAGSDCSIRINGEEYAISKRGINIVVYDPVTERVVDSVCFDTYSGMAVTRSTGTVEIPILEGNMEYIPQETLQKENFGDYLEQLVGNDRYSVLLAIKDEGTYGLTEREKELMHRMGLQEDLSDRYRCSYYAVIDQGTVKEEVGTGVLNAEGVLEDGVVYEIRSQGYDEAGSRCSIKLEGVEFAINSRGINLVLYDNELDCVADIVTFDTYEGNGVKRK